jgi:hypothetical protein
MLYMRESISMIRELRPRCRSFSLVVHATFMGQINDRAECLCAQAPRRCKPISTFNSTTSNGHACVWLAGVLANSEGTVIVMVCP